MKAAQIMRPDWSALKARVSNRLARHFRTAPFRLRNAAPMVSFTFDDAPKSAATVGVPILDAYDARATFYIAGELVGRWSGHWHGISADEIVALWLNTAFEGGRHLRRLEQIAEIERS